ncbi:hypothetical protein GCM10022409_10440 [Hymenobacter glaciei]|uniref:Uncharacterized protein n=1 Tax=Hymenobacter glaciei TaxID=877209 RepID=A0ABP7TLW9_9BACT
MEKGRKKPAAWSCHRSDSLLLNGCCQILLHAPADEKFPPGPGEPGGPVPFSRSLRHSAGQITVREKVVSLAEAAR